MDFDDGILAKAGPFGNGGVALPLDFLAVALGDVLGQFDLCSFAMRQKPLKRTRSRAKSSFA
ncbi:MAG: hypothetical protein CSA68_04020 [Rhodobacterales bacterium]|nr:MAG: hypothetical protein CSA68_04020 [Rhodobacterales bacterium]